MVLDLFGRGKTSGAAPLLQRRNYEKAIVQLRTELQKRKKDERLRLQLADMLVLVDKPKEAVEVLNGLADDLAWDGFAAKAIAVLKKIEKIQPGRDDVEEKIAYLINQKAKPNADPWASGARRAADLKKQDEGDEIGLNLGAAPAARPPEAGPAAAAPAPEPASAPAAETFDEEFAGTAEAQGEGEAMTTAEFGDELLSLIEDVFKPGAEPEARPAAAPVVETPLFSSLGSDELLAVMRKMRLKFYEPGEVIVAEGEPGDSLYIITTGSVRAYVRTPTQSMTEVRRMGEGDFFGEISILSGGVRTATIVAADTCELLEFDKESLDNISATHPRVAQVMNDFANKRRSA